MPTGYTADIEKNISFKEFALTCARAFGTCLDQRDDPLGPIVLTKKIPDKFYYERVEEAKKKQIEWHTKSYKQKVEIVNQKRNADIKFLEQQIVECSKLEKKHRKMLQQVYDWNPPSSDHKGLKDFMISQINDTIKFDCSIKYYDERITELQNTSDYDLVTAMEERIHKENIYASEDLEKEITRLSKNHNWIKLLVNSLKD